MSISDRVLNAGVILDLATIDNGDLRLDALDRMLAEWVIHATTQPEQVADRIRRAEVVVTNKVALDGPALDAAKALKLVVVAATGTNVIDLDAARSRGITVCNLRDYCSDSVAQHVLTLMLNLVTGQPGYHRRVQAGEWTDSGSFTLHDRPIRELHRLSLGIIGYGALGRAVARLARALGMNVLVGERRGRAPRANRLAFEVLIANADIISIHCPLSDETRDMFDATALARMKAGAILINTARGGIVNEAALAEALRSGRLGGAGVDVCGEEPPPSGHPLLAADIPNLILTPHNAWASHTARQACVDQITSIIGGYQRGQPVNRVV